MEIRYGAWTTTLEKKGRLLCRCDCGTVRHVPAYDLREGKSKSCGCIGRQMTNKALLKAVTVHGMTRSTEFRIWTDMKRRCHDPRRPDYHRYGGRGIAVCDEWRESFEAFYRDMGPRPKDHTLDRMHNDQGYNKQNCVWATKKRQARNTRTNRIVEVDGLRMPLVEAAERYGINYGTLLSRLGIHGWALDKALKTPVRARRSRQLGDGSPLIGEHDPAA